MKKLIFGCAAFVLAVFCVNAGDLLPGETFVDGQTVHASDLNNMVGGATVQPVYVYRQPINNFPQGSDYIVEYSPTLNGTYRVALQNIFNNSQTIVSLPNGTPVYTNNDLFAFYSAGNTNLESITYANFITGLTPYIPVNDLVFVDNLTNSVLANFGGSFTYSDTNNQPYLMTWGSNGIPTQISLSNFEANVSSDFGTNFSLPYVFNQIFAPQNVYGTNYGFTNAWGTQIPFPITSLYLTNSYNQTNTTPTLSITDTVPTYANGQKTNTTASIGAIFQLFTNTYPSALPAYTQARIQFSGNPLSLNISNTANTALNLIQVTTNSTLTSGNVYAVSVITNGTQALWANIQSNQVYYVVPQPTNTMWCFVYSNYASALASNNALTIINSGSGTLSKMIYLTNYTSFNADVINRSAGNSTETGIYDVFFRTNAVNNLYYVSGIASGNFAGGSVLELDQNYPQTTNSVQINTSQNGVYYSPPLVQVLISPQ